MEKLVKLLRSRGSDTWGVWVAMVTAALCAITGDWFTCFALVGCAVLLTLCAAILDNLKDYDDR